VTPAESALVAAVWGERVARDVVGGVVVSTVTTARYSETLVFDLLGRDVAGWRWPVDEALARHAAVVAEYRGETAEGVCGG
jgi:hypothetical protein